MISNSLSRFLVPILFAGLVACNSKEYDQMFDTNQELSQELVTLRKERDDLRATAADLEQLVYDFEKLQEKEAEMLIEFSEVKSYKEEIDAALTYVNGKLEAWLPATRKSLVGEKLGTVKLIDGEVYTGVTIVSLTDTNVEIKHMNGQDVIELENLPDNLRKALIHEATLVLETTLN